MFYVFSIIMPTSKVDILQISKEESIILETLVIRSTSSPLKEVLMVYYLDLSGSSK